MDEFGEEVGGGGGEVAGVEVEVGLGTEAWLGERLTLELVARYADRWHALFPDRPDELEPKVTSLRQWGERVGRDVDEIEWGVGVEPDDLDRFLAEDAPIYREMGFTEFTLGVNGPDWNVAAEKQWIAWRDAANSKVNREAVG